VIAMSRLSKRGLTHEAEKLQAFVRYRLPGLLDNKEDWWTYGDLNHMWRSAEDKVALEFQTNGHLLEVIEELNRGRVPPRYDIRATLPAYSFRQSLADAARKSVPTGPSNDHHEASKCICRAARKNGGSILLVEAVNLLWRSNFDHNYFSQDFVKRNCVNWAKGRLSMRTDAEGLVHLQYIQESERHDHRRPRRHELPAQQPPLPHMSSSSTASPCPLTTVADATNVAADAYADYVITGQVSHKWITAMSMP
jgi:hypothetical protein